MTMLNNELAYQNLKQGNIIAYPTEAVWGLGCDSHSEPAVSEILRLKDRPVHKGLILVSGSIDQFEPLLSKLNREHRDTLSASWPRHDLASS